MGYRVLTFSYKIGDAGLTAVQSDDGLGGTSISMSATLSPPFGWTIINVLQVDTSPLGIGPLSSSIGIPSETTPWAVSAQADAPMPYPIASGTLVLIVTAIAGS